MDIGIFIEINRVKTECDGDSDVKKLVKKNSILV